MKFQIVDHRKSERRPGFSLCVEREYASTRLQEKYPGRLFICIETCASEDDARELAKKYKRRIESPTTFPVTEFEL